MENQKSAPRPRIVVGVEPDRVETVADTAVEFAQRFQADLVFVYVDVSRYSVAELPDGSIESLPVDPEDGEKRIEQFTDELSRAITRALDGSGVEWSCRALAGSRSYELAGVAREVDAPMIIVGTRDRGFLGSMREFFNGSVAVQLAHSQERPVVVVPLHPTKKEEELPWNRPAKPAK